MTATRLIYLWATYLCLLLQSAWCQNCTTRLEINPRVIHVGETPQINITCRGGTSLRLFSKGTLMLQRRAFASVETVATVNRNDTVQQFVDGVSVQQAFYPTLFRVVINNPKCSDIGTYICSVDSPNISCPASQGFLQLRNENVGVASQPRLTVQPTKSVFQDGDVLIFTCSGEVVAKRFRFPLGFHWIHPTGKRLRSVGVISDIGLTPVGQMCNRTITLRLPVRADDNGAEVVCTFVQREVFKVSLILNITERTTTTRRRRTTTATLPATATATATTTATTFANTRDPVGDLNRGFPLYSLIVTSAATLLVTILVYTALLCCGGTNFKFPCGKRCCRSRKNHLYEIPDLELHQQKEHNYSHLVENRHTYVNAPARNGTSGIYDQVLESAL